MSGDLFVKDLTGKCLGRASWWLSLKASESRGDTCYATPCGSGRWEYVEARNADLLKSRGLDVRVVTVSLDINTPF